MSTKTEERKVRVITDAGARVIYTHSPDEGWLSNMGHAVTPVGREPGAPSADLTARGEQVAALSIGGMQRLPETPLTQLTEQWVIVTVPGGPVPFGIPLTPEQYDKGRAVMAHAALMRETANLSSTPEEWREPYEARARAILTLFTRELLKAVANAATTIQEN